jgi:diacylglycerol kinase family enzyme
MTARGPSLNPTLRQVLALLHMDRAWARGEGVWLVDAEGRRFLDCYAQYGAVALGHNAPCVTDAIRAALDAAEPALVFSSYAVCNGQYFGGGMRVAPAAALDDGRLDVTIWTGVRLSDLVRKRRALYDGTHVGEPGTRTRRATRVVAQSREPVLLEVDGEGVGRLPATIEIMPGAIRFKG